MSHHANGSHMAGDIPEFEREWIEFLTELRVALPGVQLLFAFLLTVPFSRQAEDLQSFGRLVYLVCFLATAGACAFLIAPSVYHRLHWRRDVQDKEEMLQTCNRMAIVGVALLALAMSAAMFLVTWTIYRNWLASAVATVVSLLFLWLWFGLPLARRQQEKATG